VDIFKNKTQRYVAVFSVLYILLNAFFTVKGFIWLNLLPLGVLFAYLLLFHFETYIFVLIALLPVSIPLRYFVQGLSTDISLPAEGLIIVATLYFLLKVLYDAKYDLRILKHPVSIAIILNIAWIFFTSVTSSMPLVSFKFFASRVWFIVLFYFILALIFIRYKKFYTYFWCYTLAFIPVIFYCIYRLSKEGIVKVVNVANYVTKPFFPDHTSYAAALVMIIPILVAIVLIKRRASVFQRSFFYLVLLIYLAGLLFSYTRAAWLSLIIASGLLITTRFKIKLHATFLIVIITILLLILSWTQIEIALSQNKQRSSDSLLKHVKSMTNIKNDDSNLERINRWNSALRMFQDHPVVGYGPGTYSFKYAPFQASNEKTSISTNAGDLGNSHSEYLGPLAESGVLGSLTILAIIFTTLFTASRVYFTARKRKVKYLALALLIAMLTYDIHGIMNNFLDIDKLNGLFWGFTAMIVVLDIYHSNSKEKKALIKY
jgi:putative inorganic carbon (HCO3(-)) transporter